MKTADVRGVCNPWTVVCLIVVLSLAWDPARAARGVACGDIVLDDLRLEADLVCSGPGLVVGADGVRVNLSGHVISGNGTSNGIDVANRSGVSVHGGTIRGFLAGIRALNSTNIEIKNMRLESNSDGVDLQAGSVGISIKDNEFGGNSSRGIMMRGSTTDIEVKSNTFAGNRVGVLFFATVGAVFKDNTVSNSLLAGIRLNAPTTGNLLAGNTIVSNPSGIEFLVVAGSGSTGNTLVDNHVVTNGCGLKGPLTGNTMKNNVLAGNTTDVCP
jgi:parallel beta-helix repeat protein